MKIIYALSLVIIISACSKNNSMGPDKSDLMINATAYIGDIKGKYDILFYPVKRPGTDIDNPISAADPSWVDDLFASFNGEKGVNVEQLKAYMPRGKYHLFIRVSVDPLGELSGAYTHKIVDVSNKPSLENVMEFTRGQEGRFQQWKDKY